VRLRSHPPAESASPFVVPAGSEIQVDAAGHVSLRVPGNLILQGSAVFGTLDVAGSLRVEQSASIEALEVRCGDTCFVEGSLVAWRVRARALLLEDEARAQIVLREVDRLEVSKRAQITGNFRSEEDLLLLFSRYAGQLRSLPALLQRFDPGVAPASTLNVAPAMAPAVPILLPEAPAPKATPASAPPETDGLIDHLPEHLLLALALLRKERSAGTPAGDPSAASALNRLLELLTEGDEELLRRTARTLFARLPADRDRVQRAQRLVFKYLDL
jgi:cytoskeletal protein CcmA (bactofilin family)